MVESSILVVLLMILFQVVVLANTSGTINFEAIDNGNNQVISDLEISIYKVADYDDLKFTITKEFEKSDIDITDYSEDNLFNLEQYALIYSTPVVEKITNSEGKLKIENLDLGIYLLVQNNQIDSYVMQTMLIQIPEISEKNGFNYTITVKPKISKVAIGGMEDEEEKIIDSEASNNAKTVIRKESSLVKDKVLPYTGVLTWPIPVLAISGIVIFCIAWILFYSKKKRKINIVFMLISGIMLCSSLCLLLYNTNVNNTLEKESQDIVAQLENIIENQLEKENENIVEDGVLESSQEKPIISNEKYKINGYNYIGILYIPSLNNLALPVIDTCTENNLKLSICKYSGNIKNNNLVIAGHNYRYSFGQLSKLNVGNIVYLKDMLGNTYKYNCIEILNLNLENVYEMQTGNWDLTLFTCTYSGKERLTLRFELEGQV